MKKIGLLICVLAMALTSCEGPMGPPGRDGEALNWKIVYYTVKAEDWKLLGKQDAIGSHFMYEFKENALTKTIYKDGKIVGYLIQDEGKSSEVQTPLPYTIPLGKEANGKTELWSEIYTFDFMPGSIAFHLFYSDFYTGNPPPTCTFRIVMNW
ncbi:hypothetical protein [Tannerella forsythia]|uniref:Lipoprotein n=1 Tax=Tannerella forsythia TaxID=28112 RepID=A0A3P1XJF8_TANFO|nr:hypothetical protein [Tannerella forsythia]RRD58188.1 hypothetical protein EII40_12250 [Tannerella forsythia]